MAIRYRMLLAAFAAAFIAPAASAQTDPFPELDAMVSASTPSAGMALARRQIADGELNGALGTLERVLMNNPRADSALLLHASLLCRVDDMPGARAEIAEMRAVAISREDWAVVTAACGPMQQPGSGRARP
jgi:Flp pilus assembly protein TadD